MRNTSGSLNWNQEIILTANPCANEHLFILTTIDALTRGSDYDNQFVGFFSANT